MSDEIFFDGKVYIPARDAARELGLSGDYIARLAKGGRIPARLLGHDWFVDREALPTRFNSGSPLAGIDAPSLHQAPAPSAVPMDDTTTTATHAASTAQ
jgi:hypothetical protein